MHADLFDEKEQILPNAKLLFFIIFSILYYLKRLQLTIIPLLLHTS